MLERAALARSEPDSARFGLEVWRATRLDDDPLPGLLHSAADVAIYRLPVGSTTPVRALAAQGFDVIDAGVLVYYTVDLARSCPRPVVNRDVTISLATADDDEVVGALVDGSFGNYASHYLANPLFTRSLALAGYREWALRHRSNAGTTTWIARRQGRAIAFASCEADRHAGIANGGVFGVLPSEAGGGLFSDLIRHTQAHYRELGFGEMRMSTKVDNFAVQKVWGREGFHLYAAFDTLHVNAMLSATTRPVATRRHAPGVAVIDVEGQLPAAAFAALASEAAGIPLAPVLRSTLRLADIAAGSGHVLTVRAGWPSIGGTLRANAWLHDDHGRACAFSQAWCVAA
ncbi:GNAT family N-acetyltransferase [Luteimonas sp. MJ246]|uniref:GNAT family N-acetyltransferase n=1 Tax=Luteimonas sp. MJ174 TaxID=3129237 RepID=UPI0031BB0B3D